MDDITDIDDRLKHQGTLSIKTSNPSVLVKVSPAINPLRHSLFGHTQKHTHTTSSSSTSCSP